MGTPCLIVAKIPGNPNGEYAAIRVNYDGYNCFPILIKNYNTQELVGKLMALGELSSLQESCECPPGHSYDHPVKGYCIAYGRDRGETDVDIQWFSSYAEAKHSYGESFEYICFWDGENWKRKK